MSLQLACFISPGTGVGAPQWAAWQSLCPHRHVPPAPAPLRLARPCRPCRLARLLAPTCRRAPPKGLGGPSPHCTATRDLQAMEQAAAAAMGGRPRRRSAQLPNLALAHLLVQEDAPQRPAQSSAARRQRQTGCRKRWRRSCSLYAHLIELYRRWTVCNRATELAATLALGACERAGPNEADDRFKQV